MREVKATAKYVGAPVSSFTFATITSLTESAKDTSSSSVKDTPPAVATVDHSFKVGEYLVSGAPVATDTGTKA